MPLSLAVEIPEPYGAIVCGDLVVPDDAQGLVVFAHGSGSSRHSPRNQEVARALQARQLATLLMDLLTVEEDQVDAMTREFRFNIALLAQRLQGAAQWVNDQRALDGLPIGYFGASTGAAAALVAAARRPQRVAAIVSRGGRPDLAGDDLPHVQAPTLLIVGSRDTEVLALNEAAAAQMHTEHEIAIVPGATHLFEEYGTLDQVKDLTADWFTGHFSRAAV